MRDTSMCDTSMCDTSMCDTSVILKLHSPFTCDGKSIEVTPGEPQSRKRQQGADNSGDQSESDTEGGERCGSLRGLDTTSRQEVNRSITEILMGGDDMKFQILQEEK